MEEFKKDLLSLCKRSILGPVLFLLIAVGCILLASTGTDYDPFDGTSSGYAKLDVVYVMGPFAEQTNEDGNTTNEYYIGRRRILARDRYEYVQYASGLRGRHWRR